MTIRQPLPVGGPTAFEVGVSDAITTWAAALVQAYADRNEDAVEQALTSVALAARIGRHGLDRRRALESRPLGVTVPER
jgi:hypothetical protein